MWEAKVTKTRWGVGSVRAVGFPTVITSAGCISQEPRGPRLPVDELAAVRLGMTPMKPNNTECGQHHVVWDRYRLEARDVRSAAAGRDGYLFSSSSLLGLGIRQGAGGLYLAILPSL